LIPYINSRLIQTKDTIKITREAIRQGSSGLCASSYFIENDVLYDKVFDNEESIKQEVRVSFIDIPRIHDYQE
jgi:hypothetical protein